MTVGKFFGLTALAIILITVIKWFFITRLNIDNILFVYVMWLIIALITIAICRRYGIINYLEAIVIIVTWVIAVLIVDILVLAPLAGLDIYYHLYYWITYPVFALTIFVFHKKRHVEIRRSKK